MREIRSSGSVEGVVSNRDPYSDNSSVKEERAAQSITRCSTAHHRLFRAGPRANRTFSLARNPIPCATSSRDEPQSLLAMATLAIFRPRPQGYVENVI